VKTDFQVLKLKFHSCNFKVSQHENTFIKGFRSVSGCQTYMCKRSKPTCVNAALAKSTHSHNTRFSNQQNLHILLYKTIRTQFSIKFTEQKYGIRSLLKLIIFKCTISVEHRSYSYNTQINIFRPITGIISVYKIKNS